MYRARQALPCFLYRSSGRVLPPLATRALPELVVLGALLLFSASPLKKHFQLSTVNCPLMKPLAAPTLPELVFFTSPLLKNDLFPGFKNILP
jgi:hypothetical protein